MISLSSKVEHFYTGWASGPCAFRVQCNDTGDGNFIIISLSVFVVHDLRVLALRRTILWLHFELRLDLCRLLLLGAHAADELAGLFWGEVVWILVFDWEQWAALDDALNL